MAGIAHVLIVEGLHDQMVLEALYGDSMRAAGIAILRMFGTKNLLATAELDFVDRYLDVPITVLLDYTRVERLDGGKASYLHDEERKLLELRRASKARGRSFTALGLERPDIVAYLSETAIRRHVPDFRGWRPILADFDSRVRRGSRPRFKDWLAEKYNVDLRNRVRIHAILAEMKARGDQPAGELSRKMSGLIAAAFDPQPR